VQAFFQKLIHKLDLEVLGETADRTVVGLMRALHKSVPLELTAGDGAMTLLAEQ
jgi:hypothetical protein